MKILSWAPPRHPERNVSNPFIFQSGSGTAATQEGVQTGSKKEDVIKAYGKDYKEDFGTLRYTLGNCQLSFYMTNGAVDAIEYVLVPVK